MKKRTDASGPGPKEAATALDEALVRLADSSGRDRPAQVAHVFACALRLLETPAGVAALSERADRFDPAGIFRGGPWEDPSRLLPQLVIGGLLADDHTAAMESLSELRMLAIATGRESSPLSEESAREFLRQVIVLNLSMLSPTGTEAERKRPEAHARARRLLQFLLEHLSPSLVRDAFVSELDALCAQRPIQVKRARGLIERLVELPGSSESRATEQRLELYRLAIGQPSALSQAYPDASTYQEKLRSADDQTLDHEVRAFATSLRLTGLGNPHHALLLRHLAEHDPSRIAPSLGLDAVGDATMQQQLDVVRELVEVAIRPETCDTIYGLAGVLERGLLCRRIVVKAFRRLATLSLHAQTTKRLMARLDAGSSVNANTLLLAGAISLLGQPLGVGQGDNPTCQSARALSLWSSYAPGYLLNLLIRAAADGGIEMEFEGAILKSAELTGGLAPTIHPDLDPVSLILVPHLDRVYDAMVLRATGRGADPHRWVNPALYGRWVPLGFACAINEVTAAVVGYDAFVRRFYATHHPAFNDGDDLLYPNPVGVLVTDVHGRLLGPHAVSLLRIDADPEGELRAYFFNPNNEGRQAWGPNSVVSVAGYGEMPGESSLPFAQFAARLYAFHYHSSEGGDPEAVPDAVVDAVTRDSRESWGRSFQWVP